MKFKKVIACCLTVVLLLSLTGCGKKPNNAYEVFRETVGDDSFNTVVNLLFTTAEKNTEEHNYDNSQSYELYIDADSSIKKDIGQLYAKHSINGEPFEYICQFTRNKNNIFYNIDNLINFEAASQNRDIVGIKSLRDNLNINKEFALFDLSREIFHVFEDGQQYNALPNLFLVLDNIGEDFFDSLAKSKIAVMNDETTFTEININSVSLITVIDLLAEKYDDVKPVLEKAIENLNKEEFEVLNSDGVYFMLYRFDSFMSLWTDMSQKEKDDFIAEYFDDFNLNIIMDNSIPGIVTFNISGSYTIGYEETRFTGTVKFKPIESFDVPVIEDYENNDTHLLIQNYFSPESANVEVADPDDVFTEDLLAKLEGLT